MTSDQPPEDTGPSPYRCPLCGWSCVAPTQYALDRSVAEHDDRRHGIPRVI